jgi:hypothetical protein
MVGKPPDGEADEAGAEGRGGAAGCCEDDGGAEMAGGAGNFTGLFLSVGPSLVSARLPLAAAGTGVRGIPDPTFCRTIGSRAGHANGPRTTWFRRLSRTIADLAGAEKQADDTDRLFLAWDEWRREAGGRLDTALSLGRVQLVGSHDERCEGLRVLARLWAQAASGLPREKQGATELCAGGNAGTGRSNRGGGEVAHGDVNQLLEQLEVEANQAAKTRGYGCLLAPSHKLEGGRVRSSWRQDRSDQS